MGILSESEVKDIEKASRAEVEEAVRFALESPFPAPEEALDYVYA